MKTRFLFAVALLFVTGMQSALAESFVVPLNRSRIISTGPEIAEAMVANPAVADIHVHGTNHISVIGVSRGQTTIRLFDANQKEIKSVEVTVSYDLPAVRRALKEYLPYENIGVDLISNNLVLTGKVTGAAVVDQALTIASQFVVTGAVGGSNDAIDESARNQIVNLMQVASGQQVMLRVRVGEIRRTALKQLGISLQGQSVNGANTLFGGSGAGLAGVADGTGSGLGQFLGEATSFGTLGAVVSKADLTLGATLEALENDGLLKILAEPNLVALSGEQAEFLAGGEFPVPIPLGNGTAGGGGVGIQYKPFGVSVSFIPYVLSENRIRLTVLPEVSELSSTEGVTIQGTSVPSLTTRRAKTTIELAPGESFMIAGLIRDEVSTALRQIPGINEIPILSALLRSTEFERKETELVIAVTPYLVDPQSGKDVRLPTDDYRPASTMEMFFYGALSSIKDGERRVSQTPALEGPIGFMVE